MNTRKKLEGVDLVLRERKCRSAWNKGVNEYAKELTRNLLYDEDLQDRIEYYKGDIMMAMLNGSENWLSYSYDGLSLIYNYDIANRLCTKSQLLRTNKGEKNPNNMENWLDVQARALSQAGTIVKRIYDQWER